MTPGNIWEESVIYIFFFILATVRTRQEIQCLLYAEYLFKRPLVPLLVVLKVFILGTPCFSMFCIILVSVFYQDGIFEIK